MDITDTLNQKFFETLENAIETFGKNSQYIKIVEEFGETLTTLPQNMFQRTSMLSVAEELGDSYVMICQLLIISGFSHSQISDIIHKSYILEKDYFEEDFFKVFQKFVINYGIMLSKLFEKEKNEEDFIPFLMILIKMIHIYGLKEVLDSIDYKIKRLDKRIIEFKKSI